MKRFLAISLLLLIVLHYAGLYFVFEALKLRNETEWQSRLIREDFDPQNLREASIPISFPYQSDQEEYQLVDESIELNGNFYRIVKKRYARDTLHIVYVNDYSSKQINDHLEKWANQLAQNDQTSQNKESQNLIRLIDFHYLQPEYVFLPISFRDDKQTNVNVEFLAFNKVYLNIPSPPPKNNLI